MEFPGGNLPTDITCPSGSHRGAKTKHLDEVFFVTLPKMTLSSFCFNTLSAKRKFGKFTR